MVRGSGLVREWRDWEKRYVVREWEVEMVRRVERVSWGREERVRVSGGREV